MPYMSYRPFAIQIMKAINRGRGRPKKILTEHLVKESVENGVTGFNKTNEVYDDADSDTLVINYSNDESEQRCKTCDTTFPSISALKKHACKNAYSNKKRLVACEYCVKTFCTQNAYNRHLNANHFNKRIFCNTCGKEFKLKRLLMQHHYEEHTQSKIFKCDICNVSFSWKKNLEKHKASCEIEQQRKEHFNAQDQLNQAMNFENNKSGAIIFQSMSKVAKPWICTICGKDFQYDFSFKAHMAGHDFNSQNLQANHLSIDGDNNEDEVEILVEVTNNGDAEIQMIQESYNFNSQLAALNNKNDSSNFSNIPSNCGNLCLIEEKPFACEHCDERFKWKMSLDGHIRERHLMLSSKAQRHKKSTDKLHINKQLAVSKILYARDSEEEDEMENEEETQDTCDATPIVSAESHLEAYLMGDSVDNEQASKFVTGLTNILGNKQLAASQVIESICMQKSSVVASNQESSLLRSEDCEGLSFVPVEYSVENGHLALYLTGEMVTEDASSDQQGFLISADVLCGMLNDQASTFSSILSPEEYQLLINNGNLVNSERNIEPSIQTDASN